MSGKIDPTGAGSLAATAAAMREDLRIGGEPGVGIGGAKDPVGGASFGDILEKTAMAASAKEHEAVGKAEALAQGRLDDLHGTMITMKEADISLRLVGSVRDKLLDAFHELWRINV
ncbi:MAG: flagellar hook-basal body complex protein FliE [Labilithrix sp.]|nr:flagellar hook-basal body complex protein FliE [Labilithrix sp.]MBX3210404.1 flagellar hook-basal body complex protein FliE [Labilithrix sp.]